MFGSVCHIFCRNALILTEFYAIRTPIVWHIWGAYFLQIWGVGVGVVRIISLIILQITVWEALPTPHLLDPTHQRDYGKVRCRPLDDLGE